MAKTTRRARIISQRKLLAAINKGVAAAAKRRDIAFAATTVGGVGGVIGRVVREADLDTTFSAAEYITAEVNKDPRMDGVPAVIKLPRGILMGFIDRSITLREIGSK